jgi:hypothetical protein
VDQTFTDSIPLPSKFNPSTLLSFDGPSKGHIIAGSESKLLVQYLSSSKTEIKDFESTIEWIQGIEKTNALLIGLENGKAVLASAEGDIITELELDGRRFARRFL